MSARLTDMPDDRLTGVASRLQAFRDARDWGKYHDAKSLAAAVAIEAAELQEICRSVGVALAWPGHLGPAGL